MTAPGPSAAKAGVPAEPVVHAFQEAEREHQAGNAVQSCRHVWLALSGDDGFGPGLPEPFADYEALYRAVPALAVQLASPQRVVCLAGFLGQLGRQDLSSRMLQRYLELAPDAADRDAVQSQLWMTEALGFEAAGDRKAALARVARLLALGAQPTDLLLANFGRMLSSEDPGVVVGLANLLLGRGFRWEARLLFARYLALAPATVDHEAAFDMIDRLSAEHLLNLAIAQQRVQHTTQADRLLRRALAHDPGPERLPLHVLEADLLSPASIEAVLQQARHPSTVYCLEALCRLRDAETSASLCTAWLRPYVPAA